MNKIRVSVLLADPSRSSDARTMRDLFARVAPHCGVQTHAFGSPHRLNEQSPEFARSVAAALCSDVVLFVAPERNARTTAALIALREQSGFTERLHEPEYARVWLTPDGRRSFYVIGAFPGAYAALALALEYGCGDADGAQRLRRLVGNVRELVVA